MKNMMLREPDNTEGIVQYIHSMFLRRRIFMCFRIEGLIFDILFRINTELI